MTLIFCIFDKERMKECIPRENMSNVYQPDSRQRMRLILGHVRTLLVSSSSSRENLLLCIHLLQRRVPLKPLTKSKTNEKEAAKKVKRRQVLPGISLSIQMPTVKTFGNSLEIPMVSNPL
jgi:hypothetical protein